MILLNQIDLVKFKPIKPILVIEDLNTNVSFKFKKPVLVKEYIINTSKKIKKFLVSPSLFILKPEISSIISIFNRIFSVALYIYFYICIFFYAWQNFTFIFDYLFIIIFIFLFFYHIIYSRLKLNLFINNLNFLIGNNFKLILFIYYFFLLLLTIFTLFLSYIILDFSFFKDNTLTSIFNFIYVDDFKSCLEIFKVTNLEDNFSDSYILYLNIDNDMPLFYFNFVNFKDLSVLTEHLFILKEDLKNFTSYFYLLFIFFFKIFIIFIISLFFPYDKPLSYIFIKSKLFLLSFLLLLNYKILHFFQVFCKLLGLKYSTNFDKKYVNFLNTIYLKTFDYQYIDKFVYFKIKTGDISYLLYKCLSHFFYLLVLTFVFYLLLDIYLYLFEINMLNLSLSEIMALIQQKFYLFFDV